MLGYYRKKFIEYAEETGGCFGVASRKDTHGG